MIEFQVAAVGTSERFDDVQATPPVLVGISQAMDRLRADVRRTAVGDGPVLVTGEPGSGKSLIARALHEMGPRAQKRCAVIACCAIPEVLLDIELFGCASSAVGTSPDRQGMLVMVEGGTLILENIEATSVRTQVALQRFLASGLVQPLGTHDIGIPVDTQIVATSSEPPEPGSQWMGRHHPALWSRLAAREVRVPSLRERPEDIPLLAQFFASSGAQGGPGVAFSAEAMAALSAYAWPGNVTQLKQVVRRLAAGAQSGHVRQADLPVGIRPRARSRRATEGGSKVGAALFARVRASGESFWSSVYPLFMRREITRSDLRELVQRALVAARGDAKNLVQVLNMPVSDQQRFERFLRKYECEPRLGGRIT